MKKAFYLLIVMVVLLGMLPVPAAAKQGKGMHVQYIDGEVGITVLGYRYQVRVMIVDEDGNRVFGARVIASTNVASDKVVSSITDDLGIALFNIYTPQPYMSFTVSNVVLRSYVYQPEYNLETTIDLYAP